MDIGECRWAGGGGLRGAGQSLAYIPQAAPCVCWRPGCSHVLFRNMHPVNCKDLTSYVYRAEFVQPTKSTFVNLALRQRGEQVKESAGCKEPAIVPAWRW